MSGMPPAEQGLWATSCHGANQFEYQHRSEQGRAVLHQDVRPIKWSLCLAVSVPVAITRRSRSSSCDSTISLQRFKLATQSWIVSGSLKRTWLRGSPSSDLTKRHARIGRDGLRSSVIASDGSCRARSGRFVWRLPRHVTTIGCQTPKWGPGFSFFKAAIRNAEYALSDPKI